MDGPMTFCHDARKGRNIGSHWPKHVRASAPLDLPPACSCPAHRRAPPLLAHCVAVRPLLTANAIGVKPKLSEKCHNYLVDNFGPAW